MCRVETNDVLNEPFIFGSQFRRKRTTSEPPRQPRNEPEILTKRGDAVNARPLSTTVLTAPPQHASRPPGNNQLVTFISFHMCCGRCWFQPRLHHYLLCTAVWVHLQILLVGTCWLCGSWCVAGHNHRKGKIEPSLSVYYFPHQFSTITHKW